jgi:Cyclic nucleotide-binding domain./Bacterial regulatory proteins, crp family.
MYTGVLAVNVKNTYFQENLKFWKDLTEQQKALLNRSIVKKHFNKGEALRSGSDNCSGLFLLEKGQVRAYIVSENGREITLYRLFEGDVCIFTASCIMKNINFDIFIETEKETDAYLIPASVFDKLTRESLAVQAFENELMAMRFSEVMWILEQTLFMTLDKRLAIFLLEQANIDGTDTIEITHEKIANHLGTAREVVTRMLKYFQTEGMVSLDRGTVRLTDRKKLKRLTEY